MNIYNFGSLNFDSVYYVQDFPKPGETIPSYKAVKNLGGKGFNQSIAIGRAGGAKCFHVGKIGNDGYEFIEVLKKDNVSTDFVTQSKESTGSAFITVNSSGENTIVLDKGANYQLTKEDILCVCKNASEGDIVLLQNEINDIEYILRTAKEHKLITVFNAAPCDARAVSLDLNLVDFLIINETEGEAITGESDEYQILGVLSEKYPEMKIILTLGEKGSLYKHKNDLIKTDAFKASLVDTTAAGDTFIGYFLAGIVSGLNITDALRRASKASSICVSREGAAKSIPYSSEIIVE